ncbi:MAG: 4-(cytidine 5'-diphospho)-2-C-methyl-D-erythritol kinase [Clostridia bacterium]|nr:4-(cytidine 5'-diphospho)-2-C-methyl-D-erythritol kinase [Clostridia bacterium]
MKAYAKLNLSLKIVGRREDGYHLLESEMVKIDLCDEVKIVLSPSETAEVELVCSDKTLPADRRNTAVKAAFGYMDAAGIGCKAEINIQKNIPSGAGLGGASADAAAVLLAMEEKYAALGRERLTALAARIGADVPFALYGLHARVEGIGEKLTELPPERVGIVLCKPSRSLSTAEVFASYDLDPCECGDNDLYPAALSLCPELSDIAEAMESLGLRACMSGSGSTMFALSKDPEADSSELKRLCTDCFVRPVHTLDEILWV